jgi:hypothetical protein
MDGRADRDQSTGSGQTSSSHAVMTTVFGAGGAAVWCVLALIPTLRVLGGGPPESARLAWDAPHGAFYVGLDALSAFFLLPVLGLSALAAVSGGNYLLAYRGRKSLGCSWFFYNMFVAGMVMVVSEAPLQIVGNINALTLIALGAVALGFSVLLRVTAPAEGPTWGCGYVKPTVRIQYTGRSFAEMIAEHLLPRFLRPRTNRQAARGVFPSQSDFGAACPDPFTEKVYDPFFRRWAERFSRLRILQQGQVQIYLVYIMFMVVLALDWVSLRGWWGTS